MLGGVKNPLLNQTRVYFLGKNFLAEKQNVCRR